jgi:DNA repair exonuclease SbcCD ATPase subunit
VHSAEASQQPREGARGGKGEAAQLRGVIHDLENYIHDLEGQVGDLEAPRHAPGEHGGSDGSGGWEALRVQYASLQEENRTLKEAKQRLQQAHEAQSAPPGAEQALHMVGRVQEMEALLDAAEVENNALEAALAAARGSGNSPAELVAQVRELEGQVGALQGTIAQRDEDIEALLEHEQEVSGRVEDYDQVKAALEEKEHDILGDCCCSIALGLSLNRPWSGLVGEYEKLQADYEDVQRQLQESHAKAEHDKTGLGQIVGSMGVTKESDVVRMRDKTIRDLKKELSLSQSGRADEVAALKSELEMLWELQHKAEEHA